MPTRSSRSAEERPPSLVPVFLNSAVLFAAAVGVLLFVFGVDAQPAVLGLIVVIAGVAFGAFMVFSTARSQRAIGGAEMTGLVQRALRMRALPYAADTARWRPALTHFEQRFRRNRWLLPAEFGIAALGVLYASLFSPNPSVAAGPVAVLLVGIGLATSIYSGGMRARTGLLLQELDEEEVSSGSADPAGPDSTSR
jgi:hypothetical protein